MDTDVMRWAMKATGNNDDDDDDIEPRKKNNNENMKLLYDL